MFSFYFNVLNGYKGLGNEGKKRLVCIAFRSQVAHQNGSYPGFYSMRQPGIFLISLGLDASPLQGYPPALNSLVPTYMNTPGLREVNVRIECLTKHNTVQLAWAGTRTT